MANKAVLECVDNTLRKIMGVDIPFGGKVILLSGDFRQTCPVIPRGERKDIIEASIRSSYLWYEFKIYKFTVPIRQAEDNELRAYLDTIGEDGLASVPIQYLGVCHSMSNLIDFVYPLDIIDRPLMCVSRSILCPTNRQVELYNSALLKRVEGLSRTYLSADSIKEASNVGVVAPDGYLDYHRLHTPPGLPPHPGELWALHHARPRRGRGRRSAARGAVPVSPDPQIGSPICHCLAPRLCAAPLLHGHPWRRGEHI